MNITPELETARQRRLKALLNVNQLSIKSDQQTLSDGNIRAVLAISYRGQSLPNIPLAPAQPLYSRN